VDGFASLVLNAHDSDDTATHVATLGDIAFPETELVHELIQDACCIGLTEVLADWLCV
jgi:hypothetical protein